MRSPVAVVDVDRCDTWSRYKPSMCSDCAANCCTMPVEVRMNDVVRLGWVDPFEAANEQPKHIAKRLLKAKQVMHFNHREGLFTLMRQANGDCSQLHPVTRRCTVYAQRPDTCRLHPQVGPKPGYCPYGAKSRSPL